MPPSKTTTATCGLGWSAPADLSDDDGDLDYTDWEHFMDAHVANGLVNSKQPNRNHGSTKRGLRKQRRGHSSQEDSCAVSLCVIS
mmetsp:Transcript_17040/g.32366  ORF Transcript_17040/g.32366 Transcript_17040/m.32366 type:complete len:85 (+) Transcript_17040:247-501(+)